MERLSLLESLPRELMEGQFLAGMRPSQLHVLQGSSQTLRSSVSTGMKQRVLNEISTRVFKSVEHAARRCLHNSYEDMVVSDDDDGGYQRLPYPQPEVRNESQWVRTTLLRMSVIEHDDQETPSPVEDRRVGRRWYDCIQCILDNASGDVILTLYPTRWGPEFASQLPGFTLRYHFEYIGIRDGQPANAAERRLIAHHHHDIILNGAELVASRSHCVRIVCDVECHDENVVDKEGSPFYRELLRKCEHHNHNDGDAEEDDEDEEDDDDDYAGVEHLKKCGPAEYNEAADADYPLRVKTLAQRDHFVLEDVIEFVHVFAEGLLDNDDDAAFAYLYNETFDRALV